MPPILLVALIRIVYQYSLLSILDDRRSMMDDANQKSKVIAIVSWYLPELDRHLQSLVIGPGLTQQRV
jgi:hypothetical protein